MQLPKSPMQLLPLPKSPMQLLPKSLIGIDAARTTTTPMWTRGSHHQTSRMHQCPMLHLPCRYRCRWLRLR